MGRTKKSGEPPRPDPGVLTARGLSQDDPLAALNTLAGSWGAQPGLEAWVVSQVGRLEDETAGEHLYELQSQTSDKKVRREIKRALFRLQQQGHWRSPETPEPPSTRELLGSDESAPQGWLSPIDPTGTRLLWMAGRAAGATATLSAVINEDQGLLEFHSGKTTRKALRNAQKDLSERSGIALTETPWEWTHQLLRIAIGKTERGRFAEAPAVLKAVVRDPPMSPQPPIDGLLDRGSVATDAQVLADSASLLEHPEVGAWVLPLAWMEPTLEKLATAESSIVVVSPAAREERLRETLEEASGSLLDTPDRRERFADRLEESSFLLAKRNELNAARAALGASIATRNDKPIGDVPVLAEITRRSLALALEARASEKAEEQKTSLVVTPQQAMAEQQRARRRP